jgi:hypothetical protein
MQYIQTTKIEVRDKVYTNLLKGIAEVKIYIA